MRILAIGGMPGTGKSFLMRRFKDQWPGWESHKDGLLQYHRNGRLFILGRYDGDAFDGTDRLSMAVARDALGWFASRQGQDIGVVYEGDRLFTRNILAELATWPDDTIRGWVLTVPRRALVQRRQARGSDQDPRWVKGRATKLITILERLRWVKEVPHDTTLHTESLVGQMTDFLGTPGPGQGAPM